MQLSLFKKEDLGFTPALNRQGLGIQYYGSKEILCPDLFMKFKELMPHATHFYDLFGGGGSVSWHAVASNLTTHYNELGYRLFKMYEYVFDCVANPRNEWGIFDKECYVWHDKHFIVDICQKHTGNEEAYKYILSYIWSFNCNGIGYAYGYKQMDAMEKAKIKRLGFEMVMYPYVKPKRSLKKIIDEMCEYLFADSKCKHKDFYKVRTKSLFVEFCEGKPYVSWHWIKRRKFYTFVLMLEALRVSDLWEYFAEYGENDIFKDLATFAKYPKSKMCETISRLRPDLVASAKQFKSSKGKPRGIERNELTGLQSLQRLQSLERIESLQRLERLKVLQSLQNLESLQRLERLERLERLSQLKGDLHKITLSNKSYVDFDFAKIAKEQGLSPREIIICCDIPYQDKKSQTTYKGIYADGFNIREFYQWCVTQAKNGFNVFLSEYNPPKAFLEDSEIDKDFKFVEVMSKAKQTYSQWNGDNNIENSKTALEKLFVMFGKKL